MADGLMPFEGKETLLGKITAGADVSGPWRMGLYKALTAPFDLTLTLAGVTDCDFSGYTGAIVFSPYGVIYILAARDKARDGTAVVQAHNGGGIANDVLGWYVKDIDSGTLIYIQPFDAPKTMAIYGNVISLFPTVVLGKLLP